MDINIRWTALDCGVFLGAFVYFLGMCAGTSAGEATDGSARSMALTGCFGILFFAFFY